MGEFIDDREDFDYLLIFNQLEAAKEYIMYLYVVDLDGILSE
jgi:hypothetical protein